MRTHTIATCLLAVLLALSGMARAAGGAIPVVVATVQEEAVHETVRLTGSVTAARAASLSPATSGLVTTLEVDAGSRVQRGDLLLELDPELARYQAQSAQAAAQAARLALQDARRRLDEARALAPKQSIAETLVRDLAAEVAQDEAALQQAQAEAAYREGVLERHQLRAPFDGVVAARLTDVGEWLVPGDAVLELVATQELHIDFAVDEKYLHRVVPGAAVHYAADVAGSAERVGRVATAVPVSDPGARTFLLRVAPDADDTALLPGMSVRGQLALDGGRRAPAVPRDAIIRYPDGRVIVWVVEGGTGGANVAERVVEPGLAFDGMVEVRRGLEPGARVVVKGNEALQAGQAVAVRAAAGS